jgi:endonuclease YncB( thermonuclease family)
MRLLIALFALLPCLGWADVRPAGIPEEAKYAKVDRVYDGDTLVLMGGSRARIIRLDGIDAPERDQPYGPIATAALEYMVARSVYLVEVDEDRYGRLVGQLYHSKDGYDINASMVCAGYAWWYERYAPDSQVLDNCQIEAQQAPKGLWEDEDPMPPWEWRRR